MLEAFFRYFNIGFIKSRQIHEFYLKDSIWPSFDALIAFLSPSFEG